MRDDSVAETWPRRRAGSRRSDAVYYPVASRLQHRWTSDPDRPQPDVTIVERDPRAVPPHRLPDLVRGETAPAATTARGFTRRRGVPGPSGPNHGYRSSRRALRARLARGGEFEPAGRRGSPAAARVPAPGERLRRGVATGAGRRGGPRPPAIRPCRRFRWRGGSPRRRSAARWRPGDAGTPGGGPPVGPQQGMRRRRGGAAGRSCRADPMGGSGIHRWRPAHEPIRGRDECRRQPRLT